MRLAYARRRRALAALLAAAAVLAMSAGSAARAQNAAPLAAGAEKFLGNVMTARFDAGFAEIWNQVTPEDAGKWLSVEAQRDTMVWTMLDLIFRQARANGMPVKQHTFVWGQQEPRWVAGLPPDEQRHEVDEWMRLFAERYPDVELIDVVNEPLHAPPSYAEALGGAGETGWDWVIWSFERARRYFPESTLLLNEYNILCCPGERARYLEIVRLLQERDLIDGIGVQAHGLERVPAESIAAGLDELARTGLPIYVSELELDTSDDDAQLAMYQRVFPVLWEHEAVAGVTLWGYRAGQIWKQNAYLVDWFEEDRPAMRWLREYLASAPAAAAPRDGARGGAGSSTAPAAAGASVAAAPYLDPSLPVEERVADLLSRMTLDEKIGQMTQINLSRLMGAGEWDRGPLSEAWLDTVLVDAAVGSLLSGGGAAPVPNTPRAWAETVNALQRHAIEDTRLGIPVLYGVDAVHGHNNVLGATIYPHPLGLAASFDADLVREVAHATARDVAATGISWNFAPVADLGRDPRWGRFYETFGESPAVAAALVAAHVAGQADVPRLASTLKHFVGYGAAESGRDRAPAEITLRALRDVHLPAFAAGIAAGAPTVMINSGSVDGVPVHASRYLLTDLLRGELGFTGVALSDWADVDKLVGVHGVARDRGDAVALAVNAGVDVVMVPHDAAGFTSALRAQVEAGAVPEARIDEAVRRVLGLKFALGLFEDPYVDADAAAALRDRGRDLARRAAAAGLTLLENRDGTLPLAAPQAVLVVGPGATDVPMQMGGWTIGWQGVPSERETPPAITILEGLEASAPSGIEVEWHGGGEGLAEAARAADAVVVVLGEPPYAETPGDSDDLRLPAEQERLVAELADALAGAPTRMVAVLLAGRPLILPDALHGRADALLMAYLPGTEAGHAVADALYGRTSPAGRLPFTWPASAGQVPVTSDAPPAEARAEPRYPLGHGLSYARFRYGSPRAEATAAGVTLRVAVENAGAIDAEHVVLAWVDRPPARVLAPEEELVGFARVAVAAGETAEVEIAVPYEHLAVAAGDVFAGELRVMPGRYAFRIGSVTATVELEGDAPAGD